LILAFFAVRWSAKAPAATILLPHTLHGWAWVHHWLRPAWTVCATPSAKRQPGAQEEQRDELWRHGQASQVDDDAP